MFFYILLFIWILIVPAIILLSRKELKSNIRLILAQIYNFLIFFILLIPFNIYMKKKTNMKTICYIFLSILMIGLGLMTFSILAN